MCKRSLRSLGILCVLTLALSVESALRDVKKFAPISEAEKSVLRNLPDWRFTTKAYQEEAVRLMLKEANRVAAKLPLNEQLPLLKADIVESWVSPPGMGLGLGWIATTNFNYIFDRKLCGLNRRDHVARFYEAKAKYSWPMDRMDTNRAFQVAKKLMTALDIDVAGLNRDYTLEILEPEKEGLIRKHFFPHYVCSWRGNKADEPVASIEFIEPTEYILQFYVQNTDYILREPIAIPNLAALLNQTNAPAKPPLHREEPGAPRDPSPLNSPEPRN